MTEARLRNAKECVRTKEVIQYESILGGGDMCCSCNCKVLHLGETQSLEQVGKAYRIQVVVAGPREVALIFVKCHAL